MAKTARKPVHVISPTPKAATKRTVRVNANKGGRDVTVTQIFRNVMRIHADLMVYVTRRRGPTIAPVRRDI